MTNTPKLAELRSRYVKEGYAVLPSLFDADQVAAITGEASELCRGRLGAFHGIQPGGEDLRESELLSRYLAIHHPHKLAPVMRSCMSDPKLIPILTTVVGDSVKCMQSMLFMKGPGNPGQAWHQDEYYIPTRDRSLCGLLKLNCDYSHWVVVCERAIDDLLPILAMCAERAVHVHARVGFENGPQVSDPRAPEWLQMCEAHERWWDLIWESQRRRGYSHSTLTPEFGPPSYQPVAPYTSEPLADLVAICDWMALRQRARFAAFTNDRAIP